MNEYIPISLQPQLRTQAVRAWGSVLAVISFWLVLTAAAPIAKILGVGSIATALDAFFGFICHQIPERSFHINGEQLSVCHRCFGVYSGLLLGASVYPLWRRIDELEPISRIWLFLALVPITVDWAVNYLGIWENNTVSRFLTGLILGAACSTFIVPAIVEITRNVSLRSGAKKAAQQAARSN